MVGFDMQRVANDLTLASLFQVPLVACHQSNGREPGVSTDNNCAHYTYSRNTSLQEHLKQVPAANRSGDQWPAPASITTLLSQGTPNHRLQIQTRNRRNHG